MKLYESSTESSTKSSTKGSTKGFAAPLPTQCTSYAVNGARCAQGGLRGLPFEALLEALPEALLKALYGAPKLY